MIRLQPVRVRAPAWALNLAIDILAQDMNAVDESAIKYQKNNCLQKSKAHAFGARTPLGHHARPPSAACEWVRR